MDHMHSLRTFTKEFRLYGTRDLQGKGVIRALYIAQDGESYEMVAPKDPESCVVAKYKEVRNNILAVLPEFPDGYEIIRRVETAPKQFIERVFGPEIKASLEDELRIALEQEDYTRAAAIRDKLKDTNP
jgi:hypothetical protein